MFKRILVANRGEIAVRIIRCCREMDIETVIVYSEADAQSLPVMVANYAVCIGPAKAADSYLNQDAIIETAIKMNCDAIHIKAPLVGTFYQAPGPDEQPYVKVGQQVKKGDVVGIIEAMKLMNEVVAPQDGIILSIDATDGNMVQYGQVIFTMK